jgi:LysM repeat protein
MKRKLLAFLAVGLASTLLILPSVGAVENSGVGGKPAFPRDDNPRSTSIFVHELKPGESIRDGVEVINNTDQPKTVEVYATDSLVASGGAFSCEQKADSLDFEGKWITLDKSVVELKPNGSEVVGFTIKVPESTSVGEHNACIAFSAVEAPVESSVNGVQLSFRSAIRVAITIPGEITKALTFESIESYLKGDKIIITEQVRNSGNVSLDTELKTDLLGVPFGSFGSTGGEFVVLPAQTVELNLEMKRPIWGGLYRIAATASYSDDTSLSLGETGGTRNEVARSKYIILPPTTPIIILYLLIAGVSTTLLYTHNKKFKQLELLKSSALSVSAKKQDTLESLATTYDTNWKEIDRLNNLKAPYTLEQGQLLLVVPGANYAPPKINARKQAKPKKKKSVPTTKKKPTKKTKK